MNRLAMIAALAPGASLAHGTHAPVPEAARGAAHAGPFAGLALVALAVSVFWPMSRRRD